MSSVRNEVMRQTHRRTYERSVDAVAASEAASTVEKNFAAMEVAAEKRRDEMLPGIDGHDSAFREEYRRQVYLCHAALEACGKTTTTPLEMLIKALAVFYEVNAWGHAIPDKSTDECFDLLNEWRTLDQVLLSHFKALAPDLVETWIQQILETEK